MDKISVKTIQKVLNFVKEQKLIEKNDSVLVGLSGGPDSIFLLHFLLSIKDMYNLKIVAAHLNHSLRGKESDKDENFVKKLCKKVNLELVTRKEKVKKFAKENKLNLEEAGRVLRYQFFNQVREEYNLKKIATGHTADDNAESIIFNLIRGTGVSGLAGIAIKNADLIRPILCLTKEEILDYLKRNKIKYRFDKTNLKTNYTRNLIRLKLIPKIKKINPSVLETLFDTSNLFRELKEFLELSTASFNKIFEIIEGSNEKKLKINLTLLRKIESENLSNELYNDFQSLFVMKSDYIDNLKNSSNTLLNFEKQIEFGSKLKYPIMHLIQKYVNDHFNVLLNYRNIQYVLSLRNAQKGKSIELPESLIAIREADSIIIQKKDLNENVNFIIEIGTKHESSYFSFSSEKIDNTKVEFSKSGMIEFIDAEKLQGSLRLRNWKEGDKILPLGFKSYKKVSDILTDRKLPHLIRKKILVLEDEKEIIWLVGVRLSDKYKISNKTKCILKLQVHYDFKF